jgi:hypothetical protein
VETVEIGGKVKNGKMLVDNAKYDNVLGNLLRKNPMPSK